MHSVKSTERALPGDVAIFSKNIPGFALNDFILYLKFTEQYEIYVQKLILYVSSLGSNFNENQKLIHISQSLSKSQIREFNKYLGRTVIDFYYQLPSVRKVFYKSNNSLFPNEKVLPLIDYDLLEK